MTRTEDVHKGAPLPGHVLNFTKDKTLVWGSKWPDHPHIVDDVLISTVRGGPVTVGVGDVALPAVSPSLPLLKEPG